MGPGQPTDILGGEPSPTGERDPVAVFGVEGIVEGTVPKIEGRLTERLHEANRMHIRTVADDGRTEDALLIDLDEVVAVAAPPRPPSPYRVSRRRHAVEINAGPYRVRGVAHLPLGADPQRYVASAPRKWLPLTSCTVASAGDEWAVDVVIVNLDHATREKPAYPPPRFG